MDQDLRFRTNQYPPYDGGQQPYPNQYSAPYGAYGQPQTFATQPPMNFIPNPPAYTNPTPFGLHQPSYPSNQTEGPYFDSTSMTNQMVMSFGMQYGQKMLRRTQDNFSRYLFSLDALRYYFTVNNSYVKNKIKVLLFPLRHKFRRREVDRQAHFEQQQPHLQHQYLYLPAVEDINAPDLYIPLMSFITYILLFGLLAGLRGRPSSPELLLNTGTSCLILLCLEVLILRLVCYIFPFPRPVYTMDLVCWCSYKFVGATFCLILKTLLSPWMCTALSIVFALFHGFFMFKSLQTCLAGSTNASSFHSYALYCIAGLQLPIFLWLLHS